MPDFAQILIKAKDETAAGWASAQHTASESIEGIKGLLPGLAVALTGAGMIEFARRTLDAGDQLNKMSQRTGVAVEDLSKLKYAAAQSDVDIDKLAIGIKKLSTNAFEATDSGSEAAKTFGLLKVSATDANGQIRPTNELLLDLADRFSKMEDGAGKSALAVRVFGKAGDEMIPFLNQGRDGIKQLTAEAEKLGLVMSKEAAEAAEKFNDSVNSIKMASNSLAISLINDLAPALSRIAEVMHNATVEHGAFFGLLTGAGAVAIELLGFGWKDAAERAATLEVELGRLTAKQREYQEQLAKDPSDKILQGWLKGVDFQIKAKQEELKGLQQLVEAKKKEDAEARAKGKKDPPPILPGKEGKAPVDEVKAHIAKQTEAAEAAIANYERTMALMGDTTEVAKVRYDTEFGKLAIIDDALKAQMLLRAQGIDLANQAIAQDKAKSEANLKSLEAEAQFEIEAAANMQKIQEASDKADADKAKKLFDSQVAVLDSLRTERAIEEQDYVQKQQILQERYQNDYANKYFWYGRMLDLDRAHQTKMTAIEDAEIKKRFGINQVYRKADVDSAGFFFNQLSGMMQSHSRTAFEIGKAAAITGAVIDTYKAATGAYASLASIPFIGPALGAAAAAAAIVVGFARVSAIKSQTFGSGGGGAVGTFAASPVTGLPDSPTTSGFEAPSAPAAQTALAQQPKTVTIQIIGEGLFSVAQIRDSLIPALNDAVGDGVTLRATVLA